MFRAAVCLTKCTLFCTGFNVFLLFVYLIVFYFVLHNNGVETFFIFVVCTQKSDRVCLCGCGGEKQCVFVHRVHGVLTAQYACGYWVEMDRVFVQRIITGFLEGTHGKVVGVIAGVSRSTAVIYVLHDSGGMVRHSVQRVNA